MQFNFPLDPLLVAYTVLIKHLTHSKQLYPRVIRSFVG